jgi:hypothetical protein
MIKRSLKITALLLAVILCAAPLSITAEARASDYIISYSASTTANSSKLITVSFSITANGTMDKLGATTIYLYEKSGNTLTLKKTFTESAYPNMTSSNKMIYSSSVTYQGTANTSYYAIVYIYAGKNGVGDTRSITTSTVYT